MNMKNAVLVAGIVISLLFVTGCADTGGQYTRGEISSGLQEGGAVAPSSPPAGIRLGSAYFSALGEPCYEAYPANGPDGQPRAYCMQQGQWTLLPQIYMSVPTARPLSPSHE